MVCVRACVCACVCACACVCVCMCVYVCTVHSVCVYLSMCVYMCHCVCISVYVCSDCVCVCVCSLTVVPGGCPAGGKQRKWESGRPARTSTRGDDCTAREMYYTRGWWERRAYIMSSVAMGTVRPRSKQGNTTNLNSSLFEEERAAQVRFKPTTYYLRGRCSTN